jgi:hypothetical protein
MVKFQIITIFLLIFLGMSCQKQADSTPIDGLYEGFYRVDTFTQRAISITFDKGRFKRGSCEGSFSVLDSILTLKFTKDEFCACGSCDPLANSLFNPLTPNGIYDAHYIYKLTNNQLTLESTVDTYYKPIIFNLKK